MLAAVFLRGRPRRRILCDHAHTHAHLDKGGAVDETTQKEMETGKIRYVAKQNVKNEHILPRPDAPEGWNGRGANGETSEPPNQINL